MPQTVQQLPLLNTVSPIQQKVSVFEVSAQEEKMVLLELEQQTLVLLLSQCLGPELSWVAVVPTCAGLYLEPTEHSWPRAQP